MLTQTIFDSFLFWIFLSGIVATSIYVTKVAIRMHEYEKQVDRGWDDLINRADKMIKHLDEITQEVRNIKDETEKNKNRVKKIKSKIEES